MDSLKLQIDRGDKFRSSVGGSWVELELELVVLRAGRLRLHTRHTTAGEGPKREEPVACRTSVNNRRFEKEPQAALAAG
jgi:hypothetical protein